MIIISDYDDDRELRQSNEGLLLKQKETGRVFEIAVDLKPCRFTYEEIEPEPDTEEILSILTGGAE